MQRKVVQEYQTSPHKSAIMKLQWIKYVYIYSTMVAGQS